MNNNFNNNNNNNNYNKNYVDFIYTGIGSRETPQEVLELFLKFGEDLAKLGFILRSGGANGADTYFEKGCDLVKGRKEIYLPWENFNNSKSQLYNITTQALDMAKKFHPKWDSLDFNSKLLHTRNCYQVLGKNLNNPTDFIICYTEKGTGKGGTGQALRIANYYGINVFDAGAYHDLKTFEYDVVDFVLQVQSKKSVGMKINPLIVENDNFNLEKCEQIEEIIKPFTNIKKPNDSKTEQLLYASSNSQYTFFNAKKGDVFYKKGTNFEDRKVVIDYDSYNVYLVNLNNNFNKENNTTDVITMSYKELNNSELILE